MLPVLIDGMEGVLSGQIELSFDKRDFRAIQVVRSDLTEGVLFASKVFEDKVKFSFAGAESRPGSGRIATIRFDLSAVTPAQAGWIGEGSDGMEGITLRRVQLNEGRIAVLLPSAQTASAVPTAYRLSQNFPNPFNPVTGIRYQLPEASHVELAIYDALGQKVLVLLDGFVEAGSWPVVWDAKKMNSGLYFVRMEAGDFIEVRKMVLMR